MIAITGISGQLGREVLQNVKLLAARGTRVLGLTRTPQNLSLPGLSEGDLRQLDFAHPGQFGEALEGVDTLLMVSIEGEDDLRLRLQTQAAQAAVKAGVKRIIYTSFFDVAVASPSVVARVHRCTEEAIAATGCAYTFLRNGPYVNNIAVRIAQAARSDGIFRMASGNAQMPFISRADLALAAAHALLAPELGKVVYRLSGAELLSYQQLCDIIGRSVGRPVSHVHIGDDEYRAELRAEGLSEALQERRIAYVRAMREGFMTALTDDFAQLVGHAPRAMSEVIPTLNLQPGQSVH